MGRNGLSDMAAVILAAGRGTRLKSEGTNKAMTLINGEPLICFAINALDYAGIRMIWIVKYYQDDFDKLSLIYRDRPLKIQYINEYDHIGSLHSFSLIQNYVHDRFILLDCDLIFDKVDFYKMILEGYHRMDCENLYGVTALVCNASKTDSDMLLIEKNMVRRFIKEGGVGCVRGGYIFIWDPNVFSDVPLFLRKGIYSLSQYYDYFVQRYDVGVMEIGDIWDVDTSDDISFTLDLIRRKGAGNG